MTRLLSLTLLSFAYSTSTVFGYLVEPQQAASQSQPATAGASGVEGQWAEPPEPLTEGERQLLSRAEQLLAGSSPDPSRILVDPEFAALHAHTEFRDLIAKHATTAPLTICGPEEPGVRLDVELELLNQSGTPIGDALVYVYHTSAKGWYSDKGAHIRANSGDIKHARLFGYVRTDQTGKALIHTIRPSGYPRSDLPAHIHLGVTVAGKGVPIGEIRFSDDPRLTPDARTRSEREGDVIVTPEKRVDGSQLCRAVFRLKTN